MLRYAENDSDQDFNQKFKITAKGPNSLGANDSRRIPVRQRQLHPSMLGYLDVADTSSSDPGRSGSLSPYCDMDSMYFDNSNYENEMHFKISQYLDQYPLEDDEEELKIQCDTEDQYNATLDALFHYTDGKIRIFGVSSNPMEIIVEKDPRESYRKFDEADLMGAEPKKKEDDD